MKTRMKKDMSKKKDKDTISCVPVDIQAFSLIVLIISYYLVAVQRLLLEISVVQSLKAFAVASLILSHLMHCIVDSIPIHRFCTLSNT